MDCKDIVFPIIFTKKLRKSSIFRLIKLLFSKFTSNFASQIKNCMGKGDKRSLKGKRWRKSYGKSRPKKTKIVKAS